MTFFDTKSYISNTTYTNKTSHNQIIILSIIASIDAYKGLLVNARIRVWLKLIEVSYKTNLFTTRIPFTKMQNETYHI